MTDSVPCTTAQQEIEGTVDGELAVVISSIASACKQVGLDRACGVALAARPYAWLCSDTGGQQTQP